MKTPATGRFIMVMFRASLLFVVAAGMLSVSCATPPKPRELDTLERLRNSADVPAARKKAPDLCKKGDKAYAAATEKWQSNDLNESVNSALVGTIYFNHALALA